MAQPGWDARDEHEFSEKLEKAKESLRPKTVGKPTRLPKVLYHYTSSTGLLGMARSGRVWLTNVDYMNDFSELEYGREVIRTVLTRKRKEFKQWEAFWDFAEKTLMKKDVYDVCAFCFCKNDDLLSQWRAYARGGMGYAVGFKTESIHLTVPVRTGWEIVEVLYDERKQQSLVEKVFNEVCRLAKDYPSFGKTTALQARAVRFLGVELAPCIVRFKSEGFQEEHEWRLVVLDFPGLTPLENHKFRVSPKGAIIPYLDLSIARDTSVTPRLPLQRIVQGPHIAPALGEKALESLLTKHGYTGIELERSKVTLRRSF